MTDEAIPNGTERCAQAVERLGGKFDICVNIQGDEPLIEPEIIDEVVAALQAAPDAVYRCALPASGHAARQGAAGDGLNHLLPLGSAVHGAEEASGIEPVARLIPQLPALSFAATTALHARRSSTTR